MTWNTAKIGLRAAHVLQDLRPQLLGAVELSLVAQASIYPLFIARMGCRRYEIIVRKPIRVQSTGNREADIGKGVAEWCLILEEVIGGHWDQWFAFVPIFDR